MKLLVRTKTEKTKRRAALLAIAFFCGTCAITYALLQEVTARLSVLRVELIEQAEATFGQEVSWSSIEPSILQGVRITGVRVSDVVLSVTELAIGINGVALLRGDTSNLVSEIVLHNPQFVIRTREERERLEHTIRTIQEIAAGIGQSGSPALDVRIIRGSVWYQDPEDAIDLQLQRVNGYLRIVQGELHVDAATAVSFWTAAGPLGEGEPFNLQSELRLEGSSIAGGTEIEASLHISNLQGSHLVAVDQTVFFQRVGDEITVERLYTNDALSLVLNGNAASGSIQAQVRTEELRPREVVQLRGPWAMYNSWLEEPITSDLVIQAHVDEGLTSVYGSLATRFTQDILPEPVQFTTEFLYSPDEIVLESLVVQPLQGAGSVTARGNWRFTDAFPSGELTFRGFRYVGAPRVDGRVTVDSAGDELVLLSQELQLNLAPLYNVSARLRPGARYTSLRAFATVQPDGGGIHVISRIADMTDLAGQVRLESVPLRETAHLLTALGVEVDLPGPAQGVILDGIAAIDIRGGSTAVTIPHLSGWVAEDPSVTASLTASYQDGAITIGQLVAHLPDTHILARGEGTLFRDNSARFTMGIAVNGILYDVAGEYDGDVSVNLRFDDSFELAVSRGSGGSLRISGLIEDFLVPVAEVRLTAAIEGLYIREREWFLNVTDGSLRQIPMPGRNAASAQFAASLQPGSARFAVTSLEDRFSTLAGSGEVAFTTDEILDARLTLQLRALETSEQYRVAARYADGFYAADVRFAHSPAPRIIPTAPRGTFDGTLQFVGTPDNPEIRAFVSSRQLAIQDNEARITGFFSLDENIITVRDSEFLFRQNQIGIDEILLNRKSGAVTGSLAVTRPETATTISAALQGFTDPVEELTAAFLADLAVDLTVDIAQQPAPPAGTPPGSLRYRLWREQGNTRLQRQDGAIEISLSAGGDLQAMIGGDLPVHAQVQGVLEPQYIEATVSGIRVDISALPLPDNLGGYAVPAGTARGALRILGNPLDPDIFGTLMVEDAFIQTPFSPDIAGPLSPVLIFEEKLIRIPEVETRAGRAPIRASADFLLNRLSMEQFQVAISIPEETGVHVVHQFGPMMVDGFGRGTLLIDSTTQLTRVSGNIVAYGTELSIRPEQSPGDEDGNVVVDLTIRTGRAVRFIWPDTDFPILRSNAATGQQLVIRADSRDDRFSVDGTIDIQSGDVFYFDRSFLIRDGQIEFRETQDDFDPRLTARAEIREVTPDGPVRIFLIADGQRLSEFSPRFESNPPLVNTDIIAILGGNILQTAGTGPVNLGTALVSTSDIVTQFGFFRQFENNVRNALDLDLFAIRTSFIQNILLTAINPLDENATPIAPSLGTYLNNTSIFMGRYLGDKVFGQLVVQMRSRDEQLNPTISTFNDGIQAFGGVSIDAEVSLEWQTPLFLLEWNLAPQNPQELFIRDNRFSLRWSFSY